MPLFCCFLLLGNTAWCRYHTFLCEKRLDSVAQAGLRTAEVFLPQPLKDCDDHAVPRVLYHPIGILLAVMHTMLSVCLSFLSVFYNLTKLFICVGVLPTRMFVRCLSAWCPQHPEEGARTPGTRIADGCELP